MQIQMEPPMEALLRILDVRLDFRLQTSTSTPPHRSLNSGNTPPMLELSVHLLCRCSPLADVLIQEWSSQSWRALVACNPAEWAFLSPCTAYLRAVVKVPSSIGELHELHLPGHFLRNCRDHSHANLINVRKLGQLLDLMLTSGRFDAEE